MVEGVGDRVEFELGKEGSTPLPPWAPPGMPTDSKRAFAAVEHHWGLRFGGKAPIFVDPADPSHIKTAGVLQMWLFPAAMSGLIVLFLASALIVARLGTGQSVAQADAGQAQGRWMFSQSPGPLGGGIILHAPTRHWKAVLFWSLLGVAMAIGRMMSGGNQIGRYFLSTVGAVFALYLWGFAWHTKTMEITANDQGIRMTSVLGWRDVPWALVRGVEDQTIFTTYYNGGTRMWELASAGSTVRGFAFNDQGGRTLMFFSPEVEPQPELDRLFHLCEARTGMHLQRRTIAIKY